MNSNKIQMEERTGRTKSHTGILHQQHIRDIFKWKGSQFSMVTHLLLQS